MTTAAVATTTGSTPPAGVCVPDPTNVVAGPVCTIRLAEYSAEVIRLEPPGATYRAA